VRLSGVFFCSHVIARLIFGTGLLLLAVTSHSFAIAGGLLVLASILLRIVDTNWITVIRVLRLLRWFVIPILLLHVLFTPGQLLWPGWHIPMSREGLLQGLWLSLHLATIYSIAMLMFRLLKSHEWLGLLIRLPIFGERLVIHTLMLMSMKTNMTALLLHVQGCYRLRHDWKQVPLLLMCAFKRALADARVHAQTLWLRWPNHPETMLVAGMHGCALTHWRWVFSIVWILCGAAGLLLPWFQ